MIWLYRSSVSNITGILDTAQNKGLAWGSVSQGVPRIHGLCLKQTGHVGVYIGTNVTITKPAGTYGTNAGAKKNW